MFTKPEVLFYGFPGKSNITYLGWSTVGVLRRPGRIMLLDSSSAAARPMLIDALKNRNIDIGDVTDVFLSHLHFDHAANCGLFPQATFHLSRKEWNYANTTEDVFILEGVLPLLRSFKKSFIEEDGQELFEDIRAYMTPGHTPGSTSIIGRGESGIWAFAGDAIKNREELKSGNVGITLNSKISFESIMKIKNMTDYVLPGHDCWLKLTNKKDLIPEGGNDVTITFPEGITCNGSRIVKLALD
jgi:N-acyl homoserine lactone hydrolase